MCLENFKFHLFRALLVSPNCPNDLIKQKSRFYFFLNEEIFILLDELKKIAHE